MKCAQFKKAKNRCACLCACLHVCVHVLWAFFLQVKVHLCILLLFFFIFYNNKKYIIYREKPHKSARKIPPSAWGKKKLQMCTNAFYDRKEDLWRVLISSKLWLEVNQRTFLGYIQSSLLVDIRT